LGGFGMLKHLLKKITPALTPQEKARRELFSVKMGKTDIAIDCGANVGKITQHLCKTGATVYSFEPNPFAFEVLKNKFSGYQNFHCFQKGVFIQNDVMKLYLHKFSEKDELHWSTGSSMLDFKKNVLKNKYIEVQVIDICEFIKSLDSRIRLMKMDVEGVECSILKNLIDTGLINKIDFLFVETHDHKIPELKTETDEIREIIMKRGISNVNLNWA
jgi:FkbM family methyltransferase